MLFPQGRVGPGVHIQRALDVSYTDLLSNSVPGVLFVNGQII